MHIPPCALPGLTMRRPTVSTPTDKRVLGLLLGPLLTTGRRTSTNSLRTVWHQGPGHASSSHGVLSPRRWSTGVMARAVIRGLLEQVVTPGPVLLAGDDPVTEHPGPPGCGKGRQREGVRSSHRATASRGGQQGGVRSRLVTWPLATRPWALPVLVAVSRPPAGDRGPGRRHPTPAPLARRLRGRLVRGLPARHCLVVGDSGAGTSETARFCRQHRQPLPLVSQCDGAAALYEPPPPRTPGPMGRPRVQGQPRPAPQAVVAPRTRRTRLVGAWYGGTSRALASVPGTGPWSRLGEDLVDVRWGYVHEGTGPQRDAYGLTPALTMPPQQLVAWYPPRWPLETTCQACREDRRLESATGDGQQSVLRFTPCGCGLSTRVGLLSLQLPTSASRLRASFWRGHATVTVSDRLTGVRRARWEQWCVHTRAHAQPCSTLSPSCQDTILDALAPAA